MGAGGWVMAAVVGVAIAALGLLAFSMARSIRDERTPGRSIWREFALSIVLLVLFLASWVGQGVSQWQHHTEEA